ncbi:MAG: DEAD/DEAH box helicase family protein, partial [Methylococcaceae bacterium]
MAIIEAYRIGTAEEYREWLIEEAASFGISQSKVEAMKKPVLVRVRKSKLDRVAFAVDANGDDKLAMSATEKARSDANRLDDALISKMIDGDLNSVQNRPFVLGFLQSLGDAEAAQYSTTSGEPTKQLFDRLQAAIFARAYSDDRLLEMMADDSKPEIKNIITALNSAAPDFVRAKRLKEKQADHISAKLTDSIELSLDQEAIDTIIKVTNIIVDAKNKGLLVEEFLNQGDLFGNGIDATVGAMALFIKENSISSGRLSVAFKEMASFVNKELESKQSLSLFGDSEPISLNDVLKAANDALKRQYGEQQEVKGAVRKGGFIDLFTETRGKKELREQWLEQQTTQESENARTTNVDLESDSETPRNENSQSDGTVLNDRGTNGTESGITGEPTGSAELPQQSDIGLPEIRPNSVGIPSDSSVDGRNGELGDNSRHSDSAGSSDDGGQGIPDDRQRNSELDATVRETEKLSREQKKQLQDDAEAIAYAKGEGNIRATLPFLLPEQQDDIVKIEARFETAHGMMITNGTGTGKTYTALGAIKRFAKQGKQSILIVVPGDKIAADFIESAENMHLKIKALEGITDNGGEGIAITSYANFYQNESLMRRDWDLVIFDEAHKINSNAAGDSTGAQEMMRKITGHPSKTAGLVSEKLNNHPVKQQLDAVKIKIREAGGGGGWTN